MLAVEKIKNKKNQFVRHALWLTFTIIVFAALVKLSLWQQSRGLEKQQRLARIAQLSQQSPLTLKQIVSLSNKSVAENINDYPITMSGDFDKDVIFLLDNQVEKGSLGYRVFQLVHSGQYKVLVNLGWVQGSINRQELPNFSAITGKHNFTGHIRLMETGIMLMEQDLTHVAWPLRVQQIELKKFARLINGSLLPFVIYVDEKEELGYKKNWHPIVMPPEKHQAYAVQWAGLAIAWVVLMIWFNFFSQNTRQSTEKTETNNNKEASLKPSNKEVVNE